MGCTRHVRLLVLGVTKALPSVKSGFSPRQFHTDNVHFLTENFIKGRQQLDLTEYSFKGIQWLNVVFMESNQVLYFSRCFYFLSISNHFTSTITSQRQILYLLLHHKYFKTLVTSYFLDLNYYYKTYTNHFSPISAI